MNLLDAFDGLSAEIEAVFHLAGGEVGHTLARRCDDGTVSIRYDSGWWCSYLPDGTRPIAGYIVSQDGSSRPVPGGAKRNIVSFERMTWDQAVSKYPHGLSAGFPP